MHFFILISAPSALKTAKENSLSHALSLDFQIQADRTSFNIAENPSSFTWLTGFTLYPIAIRNFVTVADKLRSLQTA